MRTFPGIQYAFGNRAQPLPSFVSLEAWSQRPNWKQVHETRIAEVTLSNQECGNVDGLWTEKKQFPIAVVTADCVPILLFRKDQKAVAALHAGWKGTLARIPDAFFSSLPVHLKDPAQWCAIMGPSIRSGCYEVSEELIQNFVRAFPQFPRTLIEPNAKKLDLVAVNQKVLEALGVEIVDIHPDCTLCTPVSEVDSTLRFLSYRAGDRLSRQYSVIQREGNEKDASKF